MGSTIGDIKGDTRSLDYGSHTHRYPDADKTDRQKRGIPTV